MTDQEFYYYESIGGSPAHPMPRAAIIGPLDGAGGPCPDAPSYSVYVVNEGENDNDPFDGAVLIDGGLTIGAARQLLLEVMSITSPISPTPQEEPWVA